LFSPFLANLEFISPFFPLPPCSCGSLYSEFNGFPAEGSDLSRSICTACIKILFQCDEIQLSNNFTIETMVCYYLQDITIS
jgi:hypothetical protein